MATGDTQELGELLDEVLRLSAPEAQADLETASSNLDRINVLVSQRRAELVKDTTPKHWSFGSRRGTNSSADTNSLLDGRISPSLQTSTVNIDASPTISSGMGFIDAIRLAALNVDQPPSDAIVIPGSASGVSLDNSGISVGSADSRTSYLGAQISQLSMSPVSAHAEPLSSSFGSSIVPASPAKAHLAPPSLSTGPNLHLALSASTRQRYFRKCFPVYRKLFMHPMKSRRFLSQKSRLFVPAISPDTLHMTLIWGSKYSIYEVPPDYNEQPKLKFEGSAFPESGNQHSFVSMNNNWVVMANHSGRLAVISLESGNIIYERDLRFGVDALDVSIKGAIIAIAIAGIDRTTKTLQPMVILICPSTMFSNSKAFEHVDTITFTSPYSDMIKKISVNSQESAIVCSTDRESRFFVISLADYREPRILLRSSRKAPPVPEDDDIAGTDQRPEGITGIKFLPNSQFLIISSFTPGSPPVILDTKLSLSKIQADSRASQSLVPTGQPQSVIMRFEKMGSSIQSCEPSPRGHGAAFADVSGAIYVVNLPSVSTETRRISICLEVAPGKTMFYAPAVRFTPDGSALLVLDRKGDLHIADFGAGHPHQPGVMKAKVLA